MSRFSCIWDRSVLKLGVNGLLARAALRISGVFSDKVPRRQYCNEGGLKSQHTVVVFEARNKALTRHQVPSTSCLHQPARSCMERSSGSKWFLTTAAGFAVDFCHPKWHGNKRLERAGMCVQGVQELDRLKARVTRHACWRMACASSGSRCCKFHLTRADGLRSIAVGCACDTQHAATAACLLIGDVFVGEDRVS